MLQQVAVEFKACNQIVADMADAGVSEVAVQVVPVGGVGAVFNQRFGPLHGTQTAQVGQPLVGHDNGYGMLGIKPLLQR